MKKLAWYIIILVATAAVWAVGHFVPVAKIDYFFDRLYAFSVAPVVFIPAAISAFIFTGHKYNWPINVCLAIIATLIIQFAIIGKDASLLIICIRALAFLNIVYILNFIKAIITKKD